jgi:transcriptional regulator with XRE-family HTH domain
MSLGHAILIVRRELGFSQKEIAHKCGVSQTSMSHIETGVKRPKKETLNNFSLATGIPVIGLYLLAARQLCVPPHLQNKYGVIYPMLETIISTLFIENGKEYTDVDSNG